MAVTFLAAISGILGVTSAHSLPILLCAAAAGGCSLALSATITNKLVGQFVIPHRRGQVLSTKQLGVPLAQLIAGFVFPWLAVAFGWRMGIGSGVVISLVALLLILLTTRHSFVEQVSHPAPAVKEYNPIHAGNGRLLLAMVLYALVTALCFQSNLFGLPLMGVEVLDFEGRTASKIVVVLGVVGFIARLLWGVVADRPFRIRRVMQTLGAGLVLGEITVLLGVWGQVPWAFWVGGAIVGTAFSLVPVVLSAVVLQNFDRHRTGLISGVVSVSTFGGFAVGPLMFGAAADQLGYPSAALMVVGVAVISMVTPFFLRNEKRTSEKPSMKQMLLRAQANLEI